MKKAIARATVWRAAEQQQKFVALWSAGMWVAALIYLLAAFSIH